MRKSVKAKQPDDNSSEDQVRLGHCRRLTLDSVNSSISCNLSTKPLDRCLLKLWLVEELAMTKRLLPEEEYCEKHCREHTNKE